MNDELERIWKEAVVALFLDARGTKFGGGVWWMPYGPNRSYRKH
jgi:hypothetical protein